MIALVTWPVVTAIGVCLLVLCFLAVLWSKREWNSRRIRIGVFLEREYRTEDEEPPAVPADESPTAEWPIMDPPKK